MKWSPLAGRLGPGPNYFSADNVTLDDQGLHIRIVKRGGRWTCGEVVGPTSLGYGTYTFVVASDFTQLDSEAIAGFFTWSDAPTYAHSEIDIEAGRWEDPSPNADNLQFVLQPYLKPGNRYRWHISPGAGITTHQIFWAPTGVTCETYTGATTDAAALLQRHTFTQGIPVAGVARPRINLWLINGTPPLSGKDQEIIVSRFSFTPLAGASAP